MFYEVGNALNMFVRPQGDTQSILENNTEYKHNMAKHSFIYKETPQGTSKGNARLGFNVHQKITLCILLD